MTAVGLSVTLVECDHVVQQRVEIGTWQDGQAEADLDRSIRYPEVPGIAFKTRGIRVQRLACRAITASGELRVVYSLFLTILFPLS